MHKNDIFAIDLGTTKFCISYLYFDNSLRQHKIEVICVPSQGMRRGMLADFDSASKALSQLIELAEGQLKCDIRNVVIGISGSHLSCRKVLTDMKLSQKEVGIEILNTLSSQAETISSKSGRYILHTIPMDYRIDDRELTINPVGLCGDKITGQFLLIEGDESYLKDLIRLCNKSGLEISKMYAEPIASASVTVQDEQKQLGVAVADIGGGTTDGVVFVNGRPVDLFTINIGGMMITKDLAIGLNVNLDEAERLKIYLGIQKNGENVQNVSDDFGNIKSIDSSETYPILGARLYELVQLIVQHLVKYKGSFGAGLLLTGGGSELKDIDKFMQDHIKVSVNKVYPDKKHLSLFKHENEPFSSKYATVIGLVNLELGRQQLEMALKKQHWRKYYLGQFLNWIKELS